MFNWLGNLFPYSDLHSLNLDWILTKMKETAAQAAKAIADSANALAQVAEAKAAALTAQTAAQDAQTAANKAAGNAASAAANAVQALNAAQTAQETAQNAQTAATSAAQTAQNAQTLAQNAQTTADNINAKFPIKGNDIENKTITTAKMKGNLCPVYVQKDNTTLLPINGGTLDVSQITTKFSFDGTKIRDADGYFLQPKVTLFKMVNGEQVDTGDRFNFVPMFSMERFTKVSCTSFTFYNNETETFYNGRAVLKKDTSVTSGLTLTFQMFFDSMPTFQEGLTFRIEFAAIQARLSDLR